MRRKLLFLFMLVLSLSLVSGGFAQEANDVTILNIGAVNDEEFPRLELLVSVQDGNSIPRLDLTQEDFSVLLDGQNVEVVSVENITNNDLPISVVLVIDTSESMAGKPLEDTKAAALAFLDQLRNGDEIAIIDFDSTVKVAQDFTSDVEAARATINGLTADGRTALYDAIYTAAEVAASTDNPRRFIVFLTDGNEYGGLSSHFPAEGGDLAKENAVPFYNIGLGYSVVGEYLGGISNNTGGDFYAYPSSETLSELYDYLGSYLRTQYVVVVDTTMEPDGATHDLTVNAGSGTVTEQYTARDLYPQIAVYGLPESGTLEEATEVSVLIDMPRGRGDVEVSVSGGQVEFQDPNLTDNGYERTFTVDPFNFAPGDFAITVTATDSEGGTRELEAPFSVVAIPPSFTVSGLSEGDLIGDPSFDITVDVAQSQQPVIAISVSVDGAEVGSSAETPATISLTSMDLGEGDHTLDVTVTDTAGTSASQSVGFSVDPALFAAPDFAIAGITDGQELSVPEVNVTVLVSDAPVPPQSVSIAIDGTEVGSFTEEPFTQTIDLLAQSGGDHDLTVTVVGGNGVEASESVPFSINPALFDPPSFTITGIEPDALVETESVDIGVEVDEGLLPPQSVSIVLDGEELESFTEAPYSHTLDITELDGGSHTLDVTVVGGNNIETTESVTFESDPALFGMPEFALAGLVDGGTVSEPEVDVTVVFGDEQLPPETITFTVDGEEAGVVTEEPFTQTIDILSLGEGEHTLEVTVVGGNGREVSESVSFTADPALFVTPTATTEPPTATPTEESTEEATEEATEEPTEVSQLTTEVPTEEVTEEPSEEATEAVTEEPSEEPTEEVTEEPSEVPSIEPTAEGETVDVPVPSDDESDEGNNILPIVGGVLLILLLIALYYFFGRGNNNTTKR